MRFLALFGFLGWRSRNGGPSAAADQDGWSPDSGGAFQKAATSCRDVRISRRDPLRDPLGVRALAQNGFLLIADIAGYTMFQRASKIALKRLVAEDIAALVA